MKRLTYLVLTILGVAIALSWSWLPSNQLTQPVQSAPSPIEIAQTNNVSGVPGDRLSTFLEADRLYRAGDIAGAEELYRQVKPEFDSPEIPAIPEPIYEPEALTPANQAYWDAAQVAMDEGDEDVALQPLQALVSTQPEFIPGTLALAKMMQEEDMEEEAIALLEQSATLYPFSAEVVMAHVMALIEEDDHLEASIAAREFALLNLDHPQASEFEAIADEELESFLKSRRRRRRWGFIGNIVGGILTGDAPWESWDSVVETYQLVQLLVADENEFGAALAEEYKQQHTLVEDPEVVDYVTQLGLEMAQLMGRDFDYEFYVVRDNAINATALPGGKIFVNTGAIQAANSQAELAGILAHEAAHSVLSHGIEGVFRGNLLEQFADEIPLGDFATGLIGLHYNRRQERQSDILGNRVLAVAGYAADGLRNFMVTVGQASTSSPIRYLESHPIPESRVEYLEELIQRNGYNRYALEGVDKHLEIKQLIS